MSQFVEKVYKSRKTLLSVLHDRGYDTEGQESLALRRFVLLLLRIRQGVL